jgi:hypothetical protein
MVTSLILLMMFMLSMHMMSLILSLIFGLNLLFALLVKFIPIHRKANVVEIDL